jgi:hypothetical protein
MPRTVLREFTGGLSNEIDAQNLREDQGEESLDINLKGYALEPGEGTAPISGGHYYYRGEWIKDSKAVSFEESGIGVVKTYNEKRPEFEEIIKDDANVSRSLGPPLPPTAVISGTVVSEGTRGERPAEGAHLLKLPETALGELDKVIGSNPATSLKTYEADPTTIIDDIHYYNGQAYWIVKPAGTPSNWTVKTRAWNSTLGEFTSSDITSTAMPHNSKGSFFKEGYFVCWDNEYIDSVVLSYTSMSGVDTIKTTDPTDNGDAGTSFLPNAGKTASTNFTTGASSTEITGVNIDQNGLITFSQRITTAGTLPTAYESSGITNITTADSADERWLRTPSDSSGRGCFFVLMRDGLAETDSDATASGVVTDSTIPEPSVFTTKIGASEADRNIFPGWITAAATITHPSGGQYAQIRASDMVVPDFGIRYAVMFVENDSWIRVRYNAPVNKPPEMFIMNKALSRGMIGGKDAVAAVTCSAYMTSTRVNKASPGYTWHQRQAYSHTERSVGSILSGSFNTSIYIHWGELYYSYQDTINITLNFPTLPGSGSKIHWKYNAPQGDKMNQSFGGLHNIGALNASSVRMFKAPGVYGSTWLSVGAFDWHETNRLFLFAVGGIRAGTPGSLAVVDDVQTPTKNVGIWTRSLGNTGSNTHQIWSQKTSKSKFRNNITTPAVPGKMHRLCSYVRGGATTQRGAFSVSELWTTARFASEDNSISFKEATTKNFRVGDWIKIGQNGTNKSMHLNLRGNAKGSDSRNTVGEQTFITAKILSIEEGVKLLLSAPKIDHNKNKKYIDEDCYPVISGFIEYQTTKGGRTTDKPAGGPICSVIQSDLESHVLVGHGYGRSFTAIPYDYARYGTRDLIEVRAAGGVEVPSTELKEQCHRISWSSSRDDLRGAGSITAPRIYYTRGGNLYSQAGLASDTAPKPVTLSGSGGYHVDKNYLTHFDNQGVTIYTPDLLSTPFVKGNPSLSDGLGLTGNVTDARTFITSQNAVYVCVKVAGYWKLVKTSAYGPEGSLLSYDFKKPIGFDGTKIWGIDSAPAGGWDIQYATPFYESSIIGSYIFFANSYTTTTPTETAWGQVVNSRIGETGNNGTPRYLSVDWKMDSGDWFGTGDPTIGLNHQANKMIVENTFKWYPVDAPINYTTSGSGTVISDIPNVTNTYRPLASAEISFKSRVYRDIVFFKQSETMLPTGGDTGGESKISFLNYTDASQSFYVLNDNSFKIVTQYGKEPEDAYRMGQATTGGTAFDASKVGISTFLIGAPNMFNAYGANIDLYYRASFINKWGHESAPSPLPSKGITALDSADDCIQVNFNAPFFRFDDTDIDTIRLYRYGGDSSEFLFLKDIPMPTLPIDSVTGDKYFPTISGINSTTNGFSRKSAISPYYLLKTSKDISSLSGFTNSNFLLTATPSSLDGSWRVNQVSENDSPSVTYTSVLAEDLNTTGTTVKLVPRTVTWAGTSSATWTFASSLNHGLVHEQLVTFSTTGAFPNVNGYNNSGGNYYNQYITDDREFYIILSNSSDPTNEFQIADKTQWEASGATYAIDGYGTGVHSVHGNLSYIFPATGVIKLKEEYISYGAVSSNDLTGCVRGIHDTNASDHKSGQVKAITVSAGGTNFGFDNGSGGFTSAYINGVSFTNAGGNLELSAEAEEIANGKRVVLETTSSLPAGLNNTTAYHVVNSSAGSPNGLITNQSSVSGDIVFSCANHGFPENMPIKFSHSDWGYGSLGHGALPLNLTPGTTYYVRPGYDGTGGSYYWLDGLENNFSVSATSGGDNIEWVNKAFNPADVPWSNGATANEIKILSTAHGLMENSNIRLTASGTSTGVSAFTFTQSGNWQANRTFSTPVSGTTSGSGTNATFNLDTDNSGSLTGTSTDGYVLLFAHGSGYAVNDTITITDPGTTSETVTITVTSIAPILPATKPNPSSWNTNVPLLEGEDYFVKNASNADYFNISLTPGGAAMEIDFLRGGYGQGTLTWMGGGDSTGVVLSPGHFGGHATQTGFQLATSSSGTPIAVTDSDLGTGTPSFNGCVVTGTGGGGTGFYATYGVNTSTGAITTAGTVVVNGGQGYTSLPTLVVSDPGPATAGSGETLAITMDAGVSANVVEWELEMEHRNQDTTTLTVAISTALTGTANVVTVSDTTVFPAASAPNTSPGPKKILIGSEILTYTGKTSTTFTGVTPATEGTIASTHALNVLVRSYDEVYATTTVTNASIEIEGFGFRDKARTPISSLYSMGLDNFPPLGLEYNVEKKQFFETESQDDYFRYIKAVGSMYFGSLDANLRFSKYGTPEYWPVDAVVTLDSEIRCIEEHAGEGLVFTTNSVYRVRGTDPKAMVAFRVPDARGLPAGYEHTVSDFNGGLIWLTASDGVAMYQAGRVTYLTRDKHDIGKLKAPYSCVVDGAYWLFQEPGSGNGYRLELATGEMRLAQTTIEAYYAYFAKALGVGVVVTKDNTINPDRDSEFLVEEIGGAKASNIEWKSKKIDAGEPAIPKALGSIAIVYESLNSTSGETIVGGIRGQALAAELLGLDPEDLDAGDIDGESETITDLYSIFTKYDEPNQTYIVDTDGANLSNTERRTILMPLGFNTDSVTVGDRVWNELLADNTEVESLTTTTISGVVYPSIVLNNEPLRTGEGTIYWGNLPIVEIYLNNDDTPSRVFTLPPGDVVEPQSMDLYLNDLKRFRTISVGIKGDVRVQSLSLRHYPLQRYQSSTLHHSADVFYKGDIDFRVMLDGSLVYRKELSNAGDDFKEERIYLPASSFGQRAHYMNESRSGMIESVNFNGSVAA